MKSGVFLKKDRLAAIMANVRQLPRVEVLVGIPEQDTVRQAGDPMTNASIGYIQENGSPAANIPARPFLAPGIHDAQDKIADYFAQAGKAGLSGDKDRMMRGLAAAGMVAATAAQTRIRDGIPPPLAQSTVNARRRRSKGSTYRRKATGPGDVTPLIDTTQLLRALTYVLRNN